MTDLTLSSIDEAIGAIGKGRCIIIVDDADRENEGDFVMAAEHITPDAINFMATHGRGLICLSMQGSMLDRLQIPMMVPNIHNRSGFGTGFTVSIEATSGVSTGISAADRSHTIQTLINPNTTVNDIAMPGHVFPLRARDGGVLERRGQTEASVDIARLAGLTPAGVICEVMAEDGTMMRLPELLKFAKEYDMPVISVEDLAQYRRALESARTPDSSETASTDTQLNETTPENPALAGLVTRVGESRLPTEHGEFTAVVFRDRQGLEHTALLQGNITEGAPLTRLHSECLTGDTLGSLRCDCGHQLKAAMARITGNGCGILLYMRQEGRGIGLGNKIKAYALQDSGFDTVDANEALGFPADARDYSVAAAMLKELGVNSVKLMSNNPEKHKALESNGVTVSELVPLQVGAQDQNIEYLQTKATRMGHLLDLQESQTSTEASNLELSVQTGSL